jgi:hypothetical protein
VIARDEGARDAAASLSLFLCQSDSECFLSSRPGLSGHYLSNALRLVKPTLTMPLSCSTTNSKYSSDEIGKFHCTTETCPPPSVDRTVMQSAVFCD